MKRLFAMGAALALALAACSDGADGNVGPAGDDGNAGKNGKSCKFKSVDDGAAYEIQCPNDTVTVRNGKDGKDGEPCYTKLSKDKTTYDLVCDGKTLATVGVKDYLMQAAPKAGRLVADGKIYNTLTFAGTTVMAQNLDYEVSPDTGSVCPPVDKGGCDTLGRHYSWATAVGLDTSYDKKSAADTLAKLGLPIRGVCPEGWHIPTRYETTTFAQQLAAYASGLPEAVDLCFAQMLADTLWNTRGNGDAVCHGKVNNLLGLSILPSGYTQGTTFQGGYFSAWLADESAATTAYGMTLNGKLNVLSGYNKSWKRPVRCFKDDGAIDATFIPAR